MLVCNVSMRPPRRAIAADLVEAGAAADFPGTGNVVFATLVDDPASVGDSVDAYLGEIMLEAANAGDTIDVGLAYAATLNEATTAAETQDGTVTAPAAFTTFDGTATDVTMSNGNLTATHANFNANAAVRSTAYKTAGKFYFEITIGVTGADNVLGIIEQSEPYNNYVSGNVGTKVILSTGNIWSNLANSTKTLGAIVAGNVIGVAVDLTARKAWLHKNGGNWNGDATHNPATGAGGVTVRATEAFSPSVGFALNFSAPDVMTGNFGQSAYSYTLPSGFGNWPA